MTEVRPFTAQHLNDVLRLCEAEGWPTLAADPARATRALTAPGVTTVVALRASRVIGFAQLLSDGEIQAYLTTLVVDHDERGGGVGRALVEEAHRLGGALRVDVLSEDEAVGFYETFRHVRKPGFRLYP